MYPVTALDSKAVVRVVQGDDVTVSPGRRVRFSTPRTGAANRLPGEASRDLLGLLLFVIFDLFVNFLIPRVLLLFVH